ncbi:hypothetical protein H5410_017083 [Solanum commersonii]|uniref:Uncharacterized protein n=1 Tax=Solanum commersonii TaxID=4109 RepID=A0A9J5ZYX0_SOLCO|nr:hypothetical protein H5410_017083 [Solanum commersonii]
MAQVVKRIKTGSQISHAIMISWLTAPLLPETVAAYTVTIDHTLRTKLHKVVVVCNTSRHKVLVEEEEEEEDEKKKKGGSRKEEEKKPLIAKLIGRRTVKLTSCGSLWDLCHSSVGFCGGFFGLRTHLIGRFINASLPSTFNSRLTDKDIPYSEAVRSSKWVNMEFISTSKEEETGLSKERAIHIDESFDPS